MTAQPVPITSRSPSHEAVEAHLRRLGRERSGAFPFGVNGPLAIVDQGIYTVQWGPWAQPEADPDRRTGVPAMIELDYVSTDRYGETHAEIAVYWSDPVDPLAMLRTRLNLVSLTARDRLATALSKRTDALGLDWRTMLDQAVRWSLEHYRRGDPGLLLRDAEELSAGADALTDPPLLEADGLSILFGDGGSLKSWVGLACAASLQAGTSYIGGLGVLAARRVGYLDWEWSARRHRRRLLQLCGPDMPEVAYIRCSRPIHEERDRLRRFIRHYGLDYGIVDSVGLACGGEPESAEVATRFVNAVGDLFPAGLGIAHVTKAAADKPPDKPFGSAYWHNSARRTWYARSVAEPGARGATVGLYNRKANDGPIALPMALAFEWREDGVSIERQDVRDIPELDAARSIGARMRDLLGRQGSMELHAIAGELEAKVESVKQAAYRGKRDGTLVNFAGPDGVYRWALRQE
jgi:hypothetical protein